MADEPGEQAPAQQQANEHVKASLLDLAAKGKGAWNAWRRDPANKDVRVTFAGIDFSEAPKDQIDFQGFEFGDHANLSQCKWRGSNWEEIQKDPGNFTPGCANFTAATFGDEASFTGAVFGDCAKFTSVTFGERANFTAAAFGNLASFVGAAFGDQANFVGAAFGELARFDDTVFKGRVEITGITFVKWQAFKALLAVGHPHRATWPPHSPGPASLVSISFARALRRRSQFLGPLVLRCRRFYQCAFLLSAGLRCRGQCRPNRFQRRPYRFCSPQPPPALDFRIQSPGSSAPSSKNRGRDKKP